MADEKNARAAALTACEERYANALVVLAEEKATPSLTHWLLQSNARGTSTPDAQPRGLVWQELDLTALRQQHQRDLAELRDALNRDNERPTGVRVRVRVRVRGRVRDPEGTP